MNNNVKGEKRSALGYGDKKDMSENSMLNDNTVNAVQKMLKNAQKQMDCKNLYQGKDSIFKSIGVFHLFKCSTMVVCIVEAATRGVPLEKVFLEISQN